MHSLGKTSLLSMSGMWSTAVSGSICGYLPAPFGRLYPGRASRRRGTRRCRNLGGAQIRDLKVETSPLLASANPVFVPRTPSSGGFTGKEDGGRTTDGVRWRYDVGHKASEQDDWPQKGAEGAKSRGKAGVGISIVGRSIGCGSSEEWGLVCHRRCAPHSPMDKIKTMLLNQ